jgi:hypothetical protein
MEPWMNNLIWFFAGTVFATVLFIAGIIRED